MIVFFNELELLELRLKILSPYVDYFVLVESNITFRGKNKPFSLILMILGSNHM